MEHDLHALRHTASHVLAQAVKRLYPATRLAIGPAIDDGFYYDFDRETPFSDDELKSIEAEMSRIVKERLPVERSVLPRAEALALMHKKDEPYKVELIEDLPEETELSFYRQGEFIDLCAGPHAASTGDVRAFKLLSVAGAYWRGSERNKMLTRIYGTAFPNKQELDDYLFRLEEAKRRDHRKIGKEMKLFLMRDEGPGFPFFLPKGMVLRNTLIDYWRQIHVRDGYQEIATPIILSLKLWETSGHWDHYRENIYRTTIDDAEYAIKPMNCPGGMLVYNSEPHSYRDLPLRIGELGLVHRHEKSGALNGLLRVRSFTQDDAHIFMTPDQITDEIKGVVALIDEVYALFDLPYEVELSTKPENSMGSEEDWEQATSALKRALDELGKPYRINEGDGAFYGPKIDFHVRDSLGRTWQCGTIQLDFQMPQRFDCEYVGADGEKHRPITIHRVVFGAIERFIGILIEHYAGKFPVWLAPVQARVLPISAENHGAYAAEVASSLRAAGVRCEVDSRNEKIGFKVRETQLERIPYMLVVGGQEAETRTVSVRRRDHKETETVELGAFVERIREQIASRS